MFDPLQFKFEGCMVGLAIGDAMGAPVEGMELHTIKRSFGVSGVTDLMSWDDFPPGAYTDDTQMSLATAAGLIATGPRDESGAWNPLPHVYRAYMAWLEGQLDGSQWRRPGRTCVGALESGRMGSIAEPINESKGCGGIMRVAPVGLALEGEEAFRVAAECAAITHGHPSGYLAAGFAAEVISHLKHERPIEEAVDLTLHHLADYEGHEETLAAVHKAMGLVENALPAAYVIAEIGEGFVAEEALAIALYCAMAFPNGFRSGVLAAVNHEGDSDSTGSICGALLGAALGYDAIPSEWVQQVEDSAYLAKVGDDLYGTFVKGERVSGYESP